MRWIMGPLALAMLAAPVGAQQDYRAADADRRAMLDRLGIADTRPGADGFNPAAPNAANYDEAKAGTPRLPELLRFANGTPVTTVKDWERRRREIVKLFDREVYGRVPATAPEIRWRIDKEERAVESGIPVVKRWLTGIADNRIWPAAKAEIALRYTLPAKAPRRLPVILSFGFPEGFRFPGPPRAPDPGPPYTEQLLKRGFGYAVVVATSIQADNGGGLDTGVIGISLERQETESGGLGRASRLGMGCESRSRCAGHGCRGRRPTNRDRRPLALRQGRTRRHGL